MHRCLTVVAIRSPGALLLRQLLDDLPIELRLLEPENAPPPSQQAMPMTMAELVAQRATELTEHFRVTAVADMSGVEVSALGGRPGVRSACFAHPFATDAENNAALLRAIEEAESSDRSASLRHVFAVASPWRSEASIGNASCTGTLSIADGRGGIGYEQLLVVDTSPPKFLAELEGEEKDRIHPRVRAAVATCKLLAALLDEELAAMNEALG